MFLAKLLAGLVEKFALRASVGESVAALGPKAGGSQAAAAFMQASVAPKVPKGFSRLFRGVPSGQVEGDFAQPVNRAIIPEPKAYVTSRAEATMAAGKGGRVFSLDVPKADLPRFSPSPLKSGSTSYQIPFEQHAVLSVPTNPMVRFQPAAMAANAGRAAMPPAMCRESSTAAARGLPGVVNRVFGGSSGGSSSVSGGGFGGRTFGGSSGSGGFRGFANRVFGSQFGGGSFGGFPQWSGSASPLRDAWSGVAQLAQPRPSSGSPQSAAQAMPRAAANPGTSYPHISPSNLVAMMGQPQGQISQTNAANAQRLAQSQAQLTGTTQKLGVAMQGLLVKAAVGGGASLMAYKFGRAINDSNRSSLQDDIDRHGDWDGDFARMRIQRRMHDLLLNRDLADATAPSAQRLNRAQMQGDALMNDLLKELKPIFNDLRTLLQQGVANPALQFGGWGAQQFIHLFKGEFDKLFQPPKDQAAAEKERLEKAAADTQKAITGAVLVQRMTADEKRRKAIGPIK